jgi:hypothetical protein
MQVAMRPLLTPDFPKSQGRISKAQKTFKVSAPNHACLPLSPLDYSGLENLRDRLERPLLHLGASSRSRTACFFTQDWRQLFRPTLLAKAFRSRIPIYRASIGPTESQSQIKKHWQTSSPP